MFWSPFGHFLVCPNYANEHQNHTKYANEHQTTPKSFVTFGIHQTTSNIKDGQVGGDSEDRTHNLMIAKRTPN